MNFCKYCLNEKKLNEYINKKQPNLITMNSKTLKLLEFKHTYYLFDLSNAAIKTYQGIKILIDDSIEIGEINFYKESD